MTFGNPTYRLKRAISKSAIEADRYVILNFMNNTPNPKITALLEFLDSRWRYDQLVKFVRNRIVKIEVMA